MSELNKKPSFNDLRFFPNKIYEDDEIIVSEFKTYDEIMNFPIKDIWGFDAIFEFDFNYVKNHMDGRFLSHFNKKEPLNSSTKFVLSVKTTTDGIEEEVFYDMNNMRIYDE